MSYMLGDGANRVLLCHGSKVTARISQLEMHG
jgi:hypothetical protein